LILIIIYVNLLDKYTPTFENSPQITLRYSHVFLGAYEPSVTLPPPRKTRYAIFASSIHSQLRSYIFYAPITAAAWQRIDYGVIVVFVGDFTLEPAHHAVQQLNLTRRFLERLGVHIIHLQCPKSHSIKLSQIVRLFNGFISNSILFDTDYVLTTDSDIIPMHRYQYEFSMNSTGFIYNAFCCGTIQRRNKTFPMYPMSHICLTKSTWRNLFLESKQRQELLSNTTTNLLSQNASLSFDLISLYMRHEFRDLYDSTMVKGDAAWYMDQLYTSMLFDDYVERHRDFSIDKRRKLSLRLDPNIPIYTWTAQRMKDFGDAHIIHDEIFDMHRWNRFKHLLNYLFEPSLVADFDFYYKQFSLFVNGKPTNY